MNMSFASQEAYRRLAQNLSDQDIADLAVILDTDGDDLADLQDNIITALFEEGREQPANEFRDPYATDDDEEF